MKIAIFLVVALLSFTIFTLGVASLPVTSFPYKSAVSYNYPINYNPGLSKPLSITGFQILEFQSAGPTINSFTASISDTNGDGVVNPADQFAFSCSVSGGGINFIAVDQTYPAFESTPAGSGWYGGAPPGSPLDAYTYNMNTGTVLWTGFGKVGGVPGTYTFKCRATNVNGTNVESSVQSISVAGTCACSTPPSEWSNCRPDSQQDRNNYYCNSTSDYWCRTYTDTRSCTYTPSACSSGSPAYCKTQSECQSVGRQWCAKTQSECAGAMAQWCVSSGGGQYYLCADDCSGIPPPTPGSICGDNICIPAESKYTCSRDCGYATDRCNNGIGNGVCESGEDPPNCWKDCGSIPSCNVDPAPLMEPGCKAAGCLWWTEGNSCMAPSSVSTSCKVDPTPYKTESACKAVGCLWCAGENKCKAATGSSCNFVGGGSWCNENSVCDRSLGESEVSCSKDCGISPGYLNGCPGSPGKCGDGACNINCNVQEDWANCYTDCPKPGASPSPISCNTIDPSGCQSENACKGTGANWCASTSGSRCSKSPCPVPTPIPPGPPKITGLGFTIQNPIIGDTTTVHCDAADSDSLKTVTLVVISPTGKSETKTVEPNNTYGTAMLNNYKLEEQGQYSLKCDIEDSDQNKVTDSETITVTKERPTQKPIITDSVPREFVKILASDVFDIQKILSTVPSILEISRNLSEASGVTRLKIEVSEDTQNTSVELKTLDAIPLTDEKGENLSALPNPGQPVAKVIQFIPSEELRNSTKKAEIEFELTDEDMAKFGISTVSDVVLARFSSGAWQELPTEFLGREGNKNKFKATTIGFSIFVVTKKASSISPEGLATCNANSDCSWYTSTGIWKCGNTSASGNEPDGLTGKPPEACGCIENRCSPITVDGRDISLRKSVLLSALITTEQFKIRFEQLGRTSRSIADYYLSVNRPADYTTWLAASQGFFEGAKKLDDVKKNIKAVKAEPTEQDIKSIESKIDEVLKILDSSLDFLLRDVLDIGVLEEEKTVALTINQSIKFEVNGEQHTLTVQSISPSGEVEFLVQSEKQELTLTQGEETNLTVATTSDKSDTNLKVQKIEKNVVYLTIKSTFLTGLISAGKEVACLDVKTNLDLDPTAPVDARCFNILADNIILDGKGKRIDGGGLLYGIKAEGRSGITIKNFVLVNYLVGVRLIGVKDSTITGMVIDAISGIEIQNSVNNKIVNNKIHLTSIGDIDSEETKEAGEIILNEIVLNDIGEGVYTPLISITNNLDPSEFKDASGNQLAAIDLIIEVSVIQPAVNEPGVPNAGETAAATFEEPVKFKKGETKLVNTGLNVVPVINGDNGYVDLKIKITALGGTIIKEFTKQVSLKGN